jgi:flavin reductase (DIM6/NTAB) family NADH-FMN oxidoreductase RutF
VTIHAADPFADPDEHRSTARQLRGRLAAAVTLWTATGPDGSAGLTVSSMFVADGEPGQVYGLIDPESAVASAIDQSGRFALSLLQSDHRQLADRGAGRLPAPGGLFSGAGWRLTDYGPVPDSVTSWAGCRVESTRVAGWSLLVEAVVAVAALGPELDPLVHFRGRYRSLS